MAAIYRIPTIVNMAEQDGYHYFHVMDYKVVLHS